MLRHYLYMIRTLRLYRHCEALRTRSNIVHYLYMIRRLKLYRHCEALRTRSNVVTLFIHDKKVEIIQTL